MPSPAVWGTIGLIGIDGAAVLVMAADVRRRWAEPGTTAFAVYAGLLGVVALVSATLFGLESADSLSFVVFPFFLVGLVPWLVFALQYTGRGSLLSRARIAGLAVALVLLYLLVALVPASVATFTGVSVWFVGLFGAIVGALAVLTATFRDAHLRLGLGIALTLAALEPWFLQAIATVLDDTSGIVQSGLYAVSFSTVALALAVALYYYDAFEATVAAGNLGREVMVEEIDDPLLVIDDDDRIVDGNPAARTLLGGPIPYGDPISDSLAVTVETLRSEDVVELSTPDGRRTYDIQVTPLSEQHDRTFGHVIALREVTERRLRQQRLEVLNRILRHNLRNKLTPVKGNAEMLAEGTVDGQRVGPRIVRAAEELIDISETARNTEQLLRHDEAMAGLDVRSLAESAVAEARQRLDDADETTAQGSIDVTVPDELTVTLEPDLFEHALTNLIENAVEHNDHDAYQVTVAASSDDDGPIVVEVRDDGPGIPPGERAVLERGEESPLEHGSGFGLWAAKWAVVRIGGDLAFVDNEPRGTIVRIELPPSVVDDRSR